MAAARNPAGESAHREGIATLCRGTIPRLRCPGATMPLALWLGFATGGSAR